MAIEDLTFMLEEIIARSVITQCIANIQRGIDRGDADLMLSGFHDDADVAYSFFDGSAVELAQILCGDADPDSITMHRPSNIWIKRNGDRAVSESYVFVYSPSEGIQSFVGGRYLDIHERRSNGWGLSHRTYVLDWNINQLASGSAVPGFSAPFNMGKKDNEDPGVKLIDSWGMEEIIQMTEGGNMEVPMNLVKQVELALEKASIHDLICAQSRGVDRGDSELLRSVWHPDATIDAGSFFSGRVSEWCDLMLETAKSNKRMAHTVSNEWIKVNGDQAVSESYVIAVSTDAADQDTITGGRYLDKYKKLDGDWKVYHRTFVADWIIEQPSTDQRDVPGSMYEALTRRGSLFPDDPIYSFWDI
tara:strand:+ start:398 stop:1480 length:1083 start_codon:yes stop_codon:yes gene_type:complete